MVMDCSELVMHDDRFDTLTQGLWMSATRRRLLRRLAVVPVVGTLSAVMGGSADLAAEHPVRRIQNRKAKARQRQRRRLAHRREVQRRDNGETGSDDNLLRDCPDLDYCCVRRPPYGQSARIGALSEGPVGMCWEGLFKGCNPCNGLPKSYYDNLCSTEWSTACLEYGGCRACFF
jgi:hypothetical protein